MAGQTGNLTVELFRCVTVDAVAIEHIREELSPHWQNAPHKFRVFGHGADGSVHDLFAGQELVYPRSQLTASRQAMEIAAPAPMGPFRRVTFAFLENMGSAPYTCVYRVRVFGKHTENDAECEA